MEIAVLHNPTAGDRELPHQELAKLLRRAGYRPKFFSLKKPAWKKPHAFDQAKLVVIAGGDGSVRKAVLHLHDLGLPFALLPLGTANNICTSLGIEGTPRQVIASWSAARRRKIDLGVAKGPWGRRLFIESVGAGLVARTISIMSEVGASAEHRPAWRKDRLHRDASVVQALAHELQPTRFLASFDGGRAKADRYLLLEIMNIRYVGPGFQLAPDADLADGWLDVVSATHAERQKLKHSLAGSLIAKRPSPRLTHRKVRVLRIELNDGELRLDDQIVLNLRARPGRFKKTAVKVEISVQPRAVEILVPR